MKIFVSYARVDKPYCVRIIETLHAHDVWYDQRLYAGQDWWKEILRRLDWCEAFIYLLSPDSVASLYCRRELEIARKLKRKIIPALINRETALPDAMRDWHYVDLSQQLTVENVTQLLNACLVVERSKATAPAPAKPITNEGAPLPEASPALLVSDAVRALELDEFDKAIVMLKQAQASGYQSRFVRIDELLRVAENALAEATQSREAEREYQHIVALFASDSTRGLACDALRKFEAAYGDYDPQNLRRHCAQGSGTQPENCIPATANGGPPSESSGSFDRALTEEPARLKATAQRLRPMPSTSAADTPASEEILPMLQWRDIPYGLVTLSSIEGADEDFGEKTVHVDNFVMSQYPVTNAQFAIFVGAPDGYRNPRWWRFSEYAARWRQGGKGVAKPRFPGDKAPRENVNWYEAMAFALWLGSLVKMKVALPTIAQWQRAAKGDDDRYYPWGDEYMEERCNTLESGLKQTTRVDRYRKGISPYGVFDLAGNVWEWTLNAAAATEKGRDRRRAVAGGSFVSPCDRAQTSFRYYLDPRVRYSSIGIRLVGLP